MIPNLSHGILIKLKLFIINVYSRFFDDLVISTMSRHFNSLSDFFPTRLPAFAFASLSLSLSRKKTYDLRVFSPQLRRQSRSNWNLYRVSIGVFSHKFRLPSGRGLWNSKPYRNHILIHLCVCLSIETAGLELPFSGDEFNLVCLIITRSKFEFNL